MLQECLTGTGCFTLPSFLPTNRIRSLYAVDYDCFGYGAGPEATVVGLGPAEAPKVEDFRYNWHNTYWMNNPQGSSRSVEGIEKHCDTCAQ